VKKILPVLAVGALALSMTACGANANQGSPSATPSGAAAWDVNETPYDQVKQGGSLTGQYDSQFATFNMNNANGNDLTQILALSPVSPVFYFMDGAGNATINPDYLTSVDTSTNSSGQLVIDMKMNPKASWNDGTQITAADWQATINAMSGTQLDADGNPLFQAASNDGYDQVQSVTQGADASEVIITFKSTYPDWIGVLEYGPMRAESCATADVFNDGWATMPLGWQSGPYMIQSYNATTGDLVEVPNPKWWGQAPKLDTITWKLISDQTAQVQAFVNQEIDYLDIGISSDSYVQASAASNSVIRTAEGPNFRQFTFNSKSPLLADQDVRQAIVMGLDRTQIASSDLAGLPGTPEPLNNNIFMPTQAGYVDLGQTTGIDYNPTKAKQLLESDGWVMGSNGFYAKNGQELDIKFAQLSGVAAAANEYTQAQSMLKAIGINLVNQPVNSQTDWPTVLTSENFDIIAFSWMGTPFPLMNVSQIYGTDGGSNFAQLTIPTVDNNADQLATEMDPAARLVLGQQSAQAIWEAVHTLPLYQRPELIACRTTLANMGAFGLARQPYDWTTVGFTS